MDITKILKQGQEIIVQVTKDPMGSKGARLTTYISLAGRYLVLLPQVTTVGISHKLSEEERARLRKVVEEVRPKDVGIIVRTVARDADAAELRKSLTYLNKVWRQVHRAAEKKRAPAILLPGTGTGREGGEGHHGCELRPHPGRLTPLLPAHQALPQAGRPGAGGARGALRGRDPGLRGAGHQPPDQWTR